MCDEMEAISDMANSVKQRELITALRDVIKRDSELIDLLKAEVERLKSELVTAKTVSGTVINFPDLKTCPLPFDSKECEHQWTEPTTLGAWCIKCGKSQPFSHFAFTTK